MTPISLSLEELLAQFLAFLPRLISGIVILLVTLYASAWLAKIAAAAMERRKLDKELIVLLRRLVRLAVLILGIIQALAQVNFDVTSLIAGLGIAGFTLRTTELRTWDGRNVFIPNGDVYVKPIINFSRDPRRRVQLAVSIKGDWEPDRLTELVMQALRGGPGVLAEPISEAVWTTSGEATTELTALYWVDTEHVELRAAQNEGVRALRAALEAKGGELSYTINASLIDEA